MIPREKSFAARRKTRSLLYSNLKRFMEEDAGTRGFFKAFFQYDI
jgi:hypothetical protein